jgi:cytochrome b6-f complex iron-sulfur subunit
MSEQMQTMPPVSPAGKPRPAKPSTTAEAPSRSRRNFLKLGVGALGMLALAEMGAASLVFLQPRSLEGEFGGVVAAGAVDSFLAGSVTEFPDGRFFLIRSQDGGFLAVYRKCTHLGCAVSWQAGEQRFACPCHGSNFDFYGNVENPPAPRALDTFAVAIDAGQVLVDTARPQSRDSFAPEQLVYA